MQSLYSSRDFPGVPNGWMNALYFRIGNQYQLGSNNCMLKYFTVKIGYTYDSVFKGTFIHPALDSFRSGLTTIYGPDTFSIACSQNIGGAWFRVPVVKNTFRFDKERFFAVEVAWGPKDSASGWYPDLAIADIAPFDGKMRAGFTFDRSVMNKWTMPGIVFGPTKYALGFDLGGPSTAITSFSNIRGLGLFPNPATGGRFHLSLDAKQPMKEVSVRISDVTGREVLSRQFSNPGKSLFEEMNLSGAAPGMYFVRITADSESFSRRVVVE
ncbi:MAG: T9SS type A sorting domain-containing protein [Bacteroidetes bacterium]|nr:T9SS type A sorting domain-containing protein [Bacteroidota bacterium]